MKIHAAIVLVLGLALTACATRVVAPQDSASVIVRNATAMLGQPYKYGGAAPGGFDCSGLVVYATNGLGLHLPRTAREQLHAGARVTRRNLQPGDLVFLRLARKELHVGIAVDAERFVHAPSSGGTVRMDSLAAPPYDRAFIGARRVVDATDRPNS